MKWLAVLFALIVAVLGIDSIASSAAEPGPSDLNGDWDGTLLVSGMKLRLALHLEAKDGSLAGSITSIDQGGAALALSDIKAEDGTLSFALTKPAAGYQATIASDGKSLDGVWAQNGSTLPLTFARRAPGAAAPVLLRPQEPHAPYAYRSEDVTYDGPAGKLAGTLTMPESGGPFAAAILIAGSGPHDRDETVFGHKPFLVLADYLTRHGIAVLRADKRGIGQSAGNGETATTEDFAADVEAALGYLKTRKEIDATKIGLVGHSEGGLIAPIVAAKDKSVAFVVLMAGPGLRGDQILVMQGHLIMQAMGASKEQLETNDRVERQVLDAVIAAKTPEEARANAKAILVAAKLNLPDAAIDARVAAVASPWFRFFLTYDPAPALAAVTCPMLALNGEKDLQVVPPQEDLAAIKAANPRATTVALPGLNHLFQSAKTGSLAEYSEIEETMAPLALNTISDWIVAQTGGKNAP